jgi:hypothetical protein
LLVTRAGGCANQPTRCGAQTDDACREYVACAGGLGCRVALGNCQARGLTSRIGLAFDCGLAGAVPECRGCFGACSGG